MHKVCHFTSAHPSDDVRIFQKECTSLAQKGDMDVYLVAMGESREENGVHVIGIGDKPNSRYKRMTQFAKKIYEKALSIDADIYHFHDPELLPYGAKLAKRGKHVIFDSHENTYEQIRIKYYIPALLRNIIAITYRTFERKWIRKFDAVIYPIKENPFEGFCKRVAVVNNTPKLDVFHQDDQSDSVAKEKSVCYVGALTPERGITHLIKACYMAGVKLILAGTFSPEGYQEELMSDPSYSCVDYRGEIDKDGVVQVYKESMIGASTIQNVGQYHMLRNLPTKVYEYMAMGLPVIVSRTPYTEELFNEYRFAVLVDPSDVNEISAAITKLSENQEMRAELIETGKRLAREVFNWRVDEKVLFDLYDNIIQEK